jgi:hypothetical protein
MPPSHEHTRAAAPTRADLGPLKPLPVMLDKRDRGDRRESHRAFRHRGVDALERVQKKKIPLDEMDDVERKAIADIPIPGPQR